MLLTLLWSLQVEYLPVAVPTERELQNPREFADRVRSQMAKALGIVCTDHSFLDIKLALAAQKLKQPQGSSMVEYARVEKLFRLDIATAQEYLAKFSAMDATHRCFIYPPPQGMKEWQCSPLSPPWYWIWSLVSWHRKHGPIFFVDLYFRLVWITMFSAVNSYRGCNFSQVQHK